MKSALRRPSWTWRLVALRPLAVDDEHPVAAGIVEEGAVGDQHAPWLGSPSVSFAWMVWPRWIEAGAGAVEQQVDLELAVADLRIDLGDLQPVGLAVDVGGRGLPDRDPAEIEFVDVGLELVAAGAVDLADPLALLKRLAELDVEAAELAGRPARGC